MSKLRFVSDAEPGLHRLKSGRGVKYVNATGTIVREPATLARINALVIPPAWTDVWICSSANGHLQAVGRDAKGRKQYRYHADWRADQEEAKYDRMTAFGKALPRIRRTVERDLKRAGLPRRKVLAAVVRLLETSLIRVGNDEYARENGSFGLTTLLDRHAEIGAGVIHFRFKGKSGVKHEVELADRRLAAVVKSCQDLPGQELLQYLDDDGRVCDIGSADVNEYLREVSGDDFSAKDFRTWAGTVLTALALQEFEAFDSETQAKRNVVAAVKSVARRLGNTPTVCRQSYVHPRVIDTYLSGTMLDALRRRTADAMKGLKDLAPEEAAVLALLQANLAHRK